MAVKRVIQEIKNSKTINREKGDLLAFLNSEEIRPEMTKTKRK